MTKLTKNSDETSIAKLLSEGRKKCGMTLREVEKVTGISNAHISLMEKGISTNPSARSLFKLVKLYDLSLVDVVKTLES